VRYITLCLFLCLLLTACTVGVINSTDLTPAVTVTPSPVPVSASATQPPPLPSPLPESSAVETQPVEAWTGVIVGNPSGAQFDDYFERQAFDGGRYGIDSLDEEIRQRILALRDTGATVRVWGTLFLDVPDVEGRQIQVTRLEAETPSTPLETQDVAGWIGSVVKTPRGSQFREYFLRDDGERFGIGSTNDAVNQQIAEVTWSGAQIQVWGDLVTGVPAVEGRQIEVERLEILSGSAEEARNLTPLATTSASSRLPADVTGQYDSWAATDGFLETSWVEGAPGSGIGEWLMLTFPGTIEVHSVSVDIGYDRDGDIFSKNNRIKKAILVFSSGEQLELEFADQRGLQAIPLARAPGPNITTTFVKVIIAEVYPGSTYDDTCLAEIEIWGRTVSSPAP
jgi:hypothetical protein